ncbi:MAG TPA: ABC transporter substrate-binding protein [Caulobacteraceae bacterium]|nr:ABC transporter substrate-binding protein [Caulobacteraceae bacterium]
MAGKVGAMFGGMKTAGVAAALAGLVALAFGGAAVRAAVADPAAARIETFDDALLGVMKAGRTLGVAGRYRKLEPVVARTFDTSLMTRFAVGPGWARIAPPQQAALTSAFLRLTAASYASSFASYSGQRFVVSPDVVTRGPDKVVSTQIVSPGEAPVTIAYRMRQSGGAWKVVDVFYNGSISELTTRRSDFAATLARGGAAALVKHLDALVAKAMQ